MHNNRLFNLTRLRLAAWYAGVIGLLMLLFSFSMYQVMAQVHWHALDQELETIAGTLHDGLEPNLLQPKQITPDVQEFLPGLCPVSEDCSVASVPSQRHVLGLFQQDGYYLRLLDPSGAILATLGNQPEGLTISARPLWQTIANQRGDRYHQISVPLQAVNRPFWGYVQIGRSLREYDEHLTIIKRLPLLLPFALLLVTVTSWWMAGLAMRPVYRSYNQIQQFTSDVAHELRTPLAATRATVESVLHMPNLSEEEARLTLQTVERQNSRLSQIVQDLLILARMDIHGLAQKHQVCCLDDLISDVVEELAVLALAENVMLTAQIQPRQTLKVFGDEEQLYRVLVNLITNAIQHTPENGDIVVRLTRDDHHALIGVQDTGSGIAPRDIPRIFDRFYRVESDRSRSTGGSGLGLAIVSAIVQAHHGSIQAQSELGKGSLFTVRLPLFKN
jgi:signal transduction histidine kinase